MKATRTLMAFAAGAGLGFVGAMLAPPGRKSLEAFQTSLKDPETHVPSRKPRREPQKVD